MTLERDELIGGTVHDATGKVANAQQNRFHSYHLFDDRQVGNIGNVHNNASTFEPYDAGQAILDN